MTDTQTELASYIGKPLDELPDEVWGAWPLVDGGVVVAWYETWKPGDFIEHAIDGTVVEPDAGYTDYLTRD
jgi:hypothetical protein